MHILPVRCTLLQAWQRSAASSFGHVDGIALRKVSFDEIHSHGKNGIQTRDSSSETLKTANVLAKCGTAAAANEEVSCEDLSSLFFLPLFKKPLALRMKRVFCLNTIHTIQHRLTSVQHSEGVHSVGRSHAVCCR